MAVAYNSIYPCAPYRFHINACAQCIVTCELPRLTLVKRDGNWGNLVTPWCRARPHHPLDNCRKLYSRCQARPEGHRLMHFTPNIYYTNGLFWAKIEPVYFGYWMSVWSTIFFFFHFKPDFRCFVSKNETDRINLFNISSTNFLLETHSDITVKISRKICDEMLRKEIS